METRSISIDEATIYMGPSPGPQEKSATKVAKAALRRLREAEGVTAYQMELLTAQYNAVLLTARAQDQQLQLLRDLAYLNTPKERLEPSPEEIQALLGDMCTIADAESREE